MTKNKNISDLRREIDRIDSELIRLLRERLHVAEAIGDIKKRKNLPVIDARRESILNQRLKSLTDSDLLTRDFVEELWKLIIAESHRVQKEEID